MADEATTTDTGAPAEAAAAETQQQASTVLTDEPAGVETTSEADAATADPAAEEKAGDEKPADKADEKGQVEPPETYADFDLPEGVTVDTSALEKASPLFKELGLNQEQAQKVVSFYADQVQAGEQGRTDAYNQLMDDWRTQSMTDKEFGGDKFEENVGVARQAIDKFGTPELKQLLSEHGVGNHPEVIRFMVKVGKLTQEDVPGGRTSASGQTQSRDQILYPKSE